MKEMNKLFENWRGFLNEKLSVGNWVYRISKASKIPRLKSSGIRAATMAMDTGHKYVDAQGNPEGRVYFFRDMDSALGIMFMRPEDAAYFIGDVEEGDDLALAMIDVRTLPKGVTFNDDPEISDLNAVYAAIPGQAQWQIEPSSIKGIRTAAQLKPLVDDL